MDPVQLEQDVDENGQPGSLCMGSVHQPSTGEFAWIGRTDFYNSV